MKKILTSFGPYLNSLQNLEKDLMHTDHQRRYRAICEFSKLSFSYSKQHPINDLEKDSLILSVNQLKNFENQDVARHAKTFLNNMRKGVKVLSEPTASEPKALTVSGVNGSIAEALEKLSDGNPLQKVVDDIRNKLAYNYDLALMSVLKMVGACEDVFYSGTNKKESFKTEYLHAMIALSSVTQWRHRGLLVKPKLVFIMSFQSSFGDKKHQELASAYLKKLHCSVSIQDLISRSLKKRRYC